MPNLGTDADGTVTLNDDGVDRDYNYV